MDTPVKAFSIDVLFAAGTDEENTGHHHLLVDEDKLPPVDKPLPSMEQVIHFGGGQTITELELEPGKHSLQLLLAYFQHEPYKPPVISDTVTITVEKENPDRIIFLKA